MTFIYRDPTRLVVTPTAGVPAYPADAVITEKYCTKAVIECSISNANGATAITHIIWGFLYPNGDPIVLATYNNLELIATTGKYVHEIPDPVGGNYLGFGVQQTFVGVDAPTIALTANLY